MVVAAEGGPYNELFTAGAAAAQLQGLTGCVNETTNNRHPRVGCWWFYVERLASAISAREMRDGGPELLHPQLPHHLQGPERSFLIVAMSGDYSTPPSIARHKARLPPLQEYRRPAART